MSVENDLTQILKSRHAGAFLFVGSGFSRRYLGLEDWAGLLSRFCVTGKPFGYYLATADGDYPTAAKLLAEDFNQYWWKAPEYTASVEQHHSSVKNVSSALRLEVSAYLSGLDHATHAIAANSEEVKLLASLNVDGIITTNWDLFLEELFPDYRTYIGQNELLFSNPQEIGEIYKIHGCASRPESLVLTSDDYVAFKEKNPYLAAKLITVFVEHPVVFLGYSLSDPNVSALLRSITLCMGKDQIEQLRRNLIFVQRLKDGEESGVSDTFLTIEGVQIPIVLVQTNDFSEVYRALGSIKRMIPARVLRYCKEQLYELVRSLEPEKKLSVVDIDAIDQKEDVEFLVGVGVASPEPVEFAQRGYEAIEAIDLMTDIIHDDQSYVPQQIIESVIRRVGVRTKYVPVFKYLQGIGITSQDLFEKSGFPLSKWVDQEQKDYCLKQYEGPFAKRSHESMKEIITGSPPELAVMLIPFLSKDKIDLDLLLLFLKEHEAKLAYKTSNYASYFRKLVALYDRLKYGW